MAEWILLQAGMNPPPKLSLAILSALLSACLGTLIYWLHPDTRNHWSESAAVLQGWGAICGLVFCYTWMLEQLSLSPKAIARALVLPSGFFLCAAFLLPGYWPVVVRDLYVTGAVITLWKIWINLQ